MKILFFDIENVFRPEHIFHPGMRGKYSTRQAGFCSDLAYVLVFGYAWLGEEPKSIYMTKKQMKKDPLSDSQILDEIKSVLDQADIVVTWYGKGHDYPFLVSRLAQRGNYLDSDIRHVDLYDVAKKKLRLSSNSLASVAKFFGVVNKSRVSKLLWSEVWRGNHDALVEMAKYCENDVRVLQALYTKMLGLNIPVHREQNKNTIDQPKCISCNGTGVYGNGYRVTRTARYKRLRCNTCGSHMKGERVLLENV